MKELGLYDCEIIGGKMIEAKSKRDAKIKAKKQIKTELICTRVNQPPHADYKNSEEFDRKDDEYAIWK